MLDLGGIPLRSSAIAARTIRWSSPAARPRRIPSRSRRSSTRFVIGDGEERTPRSALLGATASSEGLPRARAPARARASSAASTCRRLYDDRARRRHRHARTSRAAHDGAPLPVTRALVADLSQYPVPRRRPARRTRDRLRSHVDRDRARMHRGLPLLPGRHDLPPGARARSRRRSSTRGAGRGARTAATTRRRSPPSRPPTTRASRR